MATEGGESAAKRAKTHEAEMIPGVDGHRIWGFPNSIVTKLRYSQYVASTSTAGARGINVFSANGCFDPYITGGGHQPMYWDNYVNIYDQYVVLGSKIVVTYCPYTASFAQLVGIVGDDDSTITTNIEALLEQNNGVSSVLGPPGTPLVTLTQTYEPLRDFGVDAKDDGASSTSTGADPTESWCYGVWSAAIDGSSTGSCYIKVEIEYTVKFSELKTPTIS